MNSDIMKNQEGYADPTPGNALKKICKEEVDKQNAADAARMEKALKRAKCILGDAGLDVIERIVLKNKRTGKIYRINIVTWNKTAEVAGNFLHKGQRALVEGRLQIRSYEGKDGQKHWVTEVIADHLEFVEPKGSSAPSGPMDAFGPGGGPVSQPTKPQAPKVEQPHYFEEEFPF